MTVAVERGPRRAPSGARSGALLAAASAGSIVANYVFLLAAARVLGSDQYGSLAALLGLLSVVLIPAAALQMAVSREISRRVASGEQAGANAFATTTLRLAALAPAPLVRVPRRSQTAVPRAELRSFLAYLGPVAVGLVGIALVTHVDILIVKARFSGDDAGAYGAASAFARVAFFLPATILAVLFPRTAARQARGEETEDILGRSLLATAAFCGLLALFYEAAGPGLVTTTFGSDFAAGGGILAPFALAIGLFSLANVLVGYHLSRGETRYAWIVAAGVVAQVVVLALVPTSLEAVVWANVIVAAALLVAHELFVESSIPAVRAGFR